MSINVRKITAAYIWENDPYRLAQIVMNGINYTVDVRMKALRVTEVPWEMIYVTNVEILKIRERIIELLNKKDKQCTVRKSKKI